MEEIKLDKQEFNADVYKNVIDTSFTELTLSNQPPAENLDTIENLFRLYSKLFYDIPKTGSNNSHTYLITESTNYVGVSEQNTQDVQALLDEISQLRQELLEKDKTILSISSRISLPPKDITQELITTVTAETEKINKKKSKIQSTKLKV